MKKKPRSLPIGSISTGTHLVHDLIPRYLDAVNSIALTKENRKVVNAISRRFDSTRTPQDILIEDLDTLTLLLEDSVPEHTYFGAHEGDGADFGVWVDWEGIEYAIKAGEMGRSDSLPNPGNALDWMVRHWLIVNDHGNATLYRRSHNRWMKVWEVV